MIDTLILEVCAFPTFNPFDRISTKYHHSTFTHIHLALNLRLNPCTTLLEACALPTSNPFYTNYYNKTHTRHLIGGSQWQISVSPHTQKFYRCSRTCTTTGVGQTGQCSWAWEMGGASSATCSCHHPILLTTMEWSGTGTLCCVTRTKLELLPCRFNR